MKKTNTATKNISSTLIVSYTKAATFAYAMFVRNEFSIKLMTDDKKKTCLPLIHTCWTQISISIVKDEVGWL